MVSCSALVAAVTRYGREATGVGNIMEAYIIVYKYKREGEKKPGPVRQFRIYADNLDEARREAQRYANYPNIEVLDVHPA